MSRGVMPPADAKPLSSHEFEHIAHVIEAIEAHQDLYDVHTPFVIKINHHMRIGSGEAVRLRYAIWVELAVMYRAAGYEADLDMAEFVVYAKPGCPVWGDVPDMRVFNACADMILDACQPGGAVTFEVPRNVTLVRGAGYSVKPVSLPMWRRCVIAMRRCSVAVTMSGADISIERPPDADQEQTRPNFAGALIN